MLTKIGMGLVGTGFLADVYCRCYSEIPEVELIAVSSRTKSGARDFAKRFGIKACYADYERMMKRTDVDAVNVCVPNYLHAPVAISAAENGKHVLCTKPLAISMGEVDEMLKACESSGVTLMYGENWLFVPAAERVKGVIKEGALGRILAVEAREQHSGSHSPYATKKEFCGGGVLIHMAVHPIGFTMHVMDQPVRRVYAELGNLLHDIEVEDYVMLLMRFKDGGSGVVHSNYITKGGMQDRIEIYGTKGMAFIDLTHRNPVQLYSDVGYSYVVEKASTSRGWTSPVIDEKSHYGFVNMLKHFVDCLVEDKKPISTGDFGKDVLEVVFAGYESHEKGKAIIL
jgi:myo-inositol 2-dehydrogenase/D-chiro-inositol 1-dehydrogenase